MIKRTFAQIAQLSGGTLSPAAEQVNDHTIEGVTTDSRKIEPGQLFIPLKGENFNGHHFVEDALGMGAALAFWETGEGEAPEHLPLVLVDNTLEALQQLAASYRAQLPVRVIGVTGSNGKTTTKDMVAAILSTTYKVHKTQGNFNNHIGLPLTLLQLEEDTEMAVIEMGMSGRGEIDLLSSIAGPEAALITNIGESHLLQLGSRKAIAEAKLEITAGLKADGLLVYNGDEPLLEEGLKQLDLPEEMLRFRFGMGDTNDLYPVGVMTDGDGTRFTLNLPNSSAFFIPMLGIHNVSNALAAIAVSKYMGVSEADIAKGLKDLKVTGMRIEIVKGKTGLTILNDAYNASPTSTKAALRLLEDLSGYRKKIAVLGDMLELGSEEADFHREIGRGLQPHLIDYVYTYGELAKLIAEEAEKQYPAGRVQAFDSKEDIVKKIASIVEPDVDIVLVKGSRGMKLEDVVNGLSELHF
ncbi:UDP-N-acetylmuramoyl-tripeptide--D-alanyl-D-alanine ligase [Paenibacillus gansuensis]|uniref:UDP-N-acetylmuramoyl-tripeptide--D-alanyl-D-alanine ligase n=1 Tax=Paenibacillus gansuensis TaxID=306542 RepID=A0ABW5PCY3_9BACL